MPKGVYDRTGKQPWNKGLTKETDERVAKNLEARNKTMMEKYGSTTYNNSEKRKNTCLEKYGVENSFLIQNYDEWLEKSKATCLLKYGTEFASQNEFQKIKTYNSFVKNNGVKSCSQLPGVSEKISNKLKSDSVQLKMKQTCLDRYNVEYVSQLESVKKKVKQTKLKRYGDENYTNKQKEYETKKANGTLSNYVSKPEKEYHKYLCEKYGENDVETQYLSSEYPFKADFYIKSIDTYIELQANPRHGNHLFDENNEEDIKLLEELEYKTMNGDSWSKQILAQWHDLDLRKWECGIKNNLNLIFVYKNPENDVVYSHVKA